MQKLIKYKGLNKHSQEELEQIVDDLSEQLINQKFEFDKVTLMYNKLSELVRELYQTKNDKNLKAKEKKIALRLSSYIQEFAEENNFKL